MLAKLYKRYRKYIHSFIHSSEYSLVSGGRGSRMDPSGIQWAPVSDQLRTVVKTQTRLGRTLTPA
jgi:hypothetical protein